MSTHSFAVEPRIYQLVVEQAKDYAVLVLDPDGRVRTWNVGAQQMKGYASEEIIGRHFSIFYPREAVAKGWPAHELKIAATEGRFEDEGWRIRKDGSRFWANVVITALREDNGELLGYSKIVRDVTDRRQHEEALRHSEERLRLLIAGVTDHAIFTLDTEGVVTSWNTGAERIKGYSRDEIVGKHFSKFYALEDVDAGKPTAELAVARSTGRSEDEGWRIRKSGERFWARVIISALHDADGRLYGFAKVTQDLTERRQAEEALHAEVAERRRTDEELRRLNESLERVVAERTVELTAANRELLEAKLRLQDLSARLIAAQEEERGRIARELHDETGQALTLIRLNLKDALQNTDKRARRMEESIQIVDRAVVQIRNMAISLRPPMLDDLGLADALEWALERQAQVAGWRVSMDADELPERLPSEIETACFRIGQEALTNIARHANAANVEVRLSVADSEVELTVRDDGSGFDHEALQSDEARRDHFGLVSMTERANLAGGKLEIRTARGSGTRIRATFRLGAHALAAGSPYSPQG